MTYDRYILLIDKYSTYTRYAWLSCRGTSTTEEHYHLLRIHLLHYKQIL